MVLITPGSQVRNLLRAFFISQQREENTREEKKTKEKKTKEKKTKEKKPKVKCVGLR